MIARTPLLLLFLGLIAGCAGYNSYPNSPQTAYGWGTGGAYGPGYGGYGYAPPYPYGYYPGPEYRYPPGYGSHRPSRPPLSAEQRALNYLYDHRRQIQRLPPQQQKDVARMAERLINRLPQPPHHAHPHPRPPPRHRS